MAAASIVSENQDQIGWVTISSCSLPFVTRIVNDERLQFVSVRMAENNLLQRYISQLHINVMKFSPAKSLYMNNFEAKYFNKMNQIHRDKLYKENTPFKTTDCIVRVEDVKEFHIFIEFCHTKLFNDVIPNTYDKCGFICVSDEFDMSVIPYIVKDNIKYTPLFFFETESDLTPLCKKMEGWCIAYLKFCFKVMDINYELFLSIDSYMMISISNIKRYFQRFTRFHKLWPPNFDRWDLIDHTRTNRSGSWVKIPLQIPATENIHEQQANQMDSSIMAQGSNVDHDLESSP
ncbi:uncharacterized protein LOC112598377 [Melanaphis sacchari]|uniref:uncharacterized protein LOC112598377 n=1 Tax=Melanaphis sacchari TaxID=742174 RepID=UPI000DC159A0|nr:uncharacterized protein LOC112598377 [Melanaphis sacchari]